VDGEFFHRREENKGTTQYQATPQVGERDAKESPDASIAECQGGFAQANWELMERRADRPQCFCEKVDGEANDEKRECQV
jgi:hypothetical protein